MERKFLPLNHVVLESPGFDLDDALRICTSKAAAQVADMTDQIIVDAIIDVARAEGITDLYLIDKKFIMDAIREKMKREGIK